MNLYYVLFSTEEGRMSELECKPKYWIISIKPACLLKGSWCTEIYSCPQLKSSWVVSVVKMMSKWNRLNHVIRRWYRMWTPWVRNGSGLKTQIYSLLYHELCALTQITSSDCHFLRLQHSLLGSEDQMRYCVEWVFLTQKALCTSLVWITNYNWSSSLMLKYLHPRCYNDT